MAIAEDSGLTAPVTTTKYTQEARAVGDARIVEAGFSGINLSLGNKVFTGSTDIAAYDNGRDEVAGTGTATTDVASTEWDESLDYAGMKGVERDAAKAKSLVTDIDTAIAFVSEKLTSLGTGSKALSSHLGFMSKLQDSLDAGVGDLVDADLAKESARLQALQTKQQLGIQALSIANSTSSSLPALFR